MLKDKLAEGKWKGKLTKENFLVLALMGVLLLVIAWPVKDEKKLSESVQLDSENDMLDIQTKQQTHVLYDGGAESGYRPEYAAYLEDALEQFLSTVDGVGKVQVMVTLEDGGETFVEKDLVTVREGTTEVDSGGSRNTTDLSETEATVYRKAKDGDTPFVRQVKYPKVAGVVVSAQGGGNAAVVQKITKAIQALFGLEAHKIIIVKMISS
ncbi:MAG: stage III sporulation protein AG [Lachnospiraceae bacterium]|nr:stage III sporulation protein AG [Lachnospiraceae bacterium]